MARRQEIEQGIAFACASLNDLDVAAHHTQELENILSEGVDRGFPPNTHETEQLKMCVKSFSPVAQMFTLTANNAMESLVSVLKPRIRAIVTDAVGGDGSSAASGFSVMTGGSSRVTDRHAVRMNYDLNEEAYQLLEVSEGYISRLYVRTSSCNHVCVCACACAWFVSIAKRNWSWHTSFRLICSIYDLQVHVFGRTHSTSVLSPRPATIR
jgi:hypothetical protein